jgi:hypothetical protein
MLIAYSGGCTTYGSRKMPRIFKTVRLRVENIDIAVHRRHHQARW